MNSPKKTTSSVLILTILSTTLSAILSAVLFRSVPAQASQTSTEVKAPRGGEIKAIGNGYVEVVNTRSALKIFIYDKNLKARRQLKDVSIIAEIQRSTSKELENLELKPAPGGYTAKFDTSEVPKFYLDIGIADRKTGHADRISFDFEAATPAL